MGKLSAIVGGQYGSEAKGAVCAFLVRRNRERGIRSVVVRVAGPNAGHTAYDDSGRPWALRQVPVGMVADPNALGVIADGSEIDLPVLLEEIYQLDQAGLNVSPRLLLSPRATMLTDQHHHIESQATMHQRLGSTGKGIGACRADRIMRRAITLGDIADALGEFAEDSYAGIERNRPDYLSILPGLQIAPGSTASELHASLNSDDHVMIEGTQGYGLGLHRPEYPRVTSSDTRAIDFLAMAGINPWDPTVDQFDVWMVVRAFPIRVAGNSGPLFEETTWDQLNLPVELTTVTKKPRRVGRWDRQLYLDALRANGGPDTVRVAYSMADQECPEIAGLNGDLLSVRAGLTEDNEQQVRDEIRRIIDRLKPGYVSYIGTGPNSAIWGL